MEQNVRYKCLVEETEAHVVVRALLLLGGLFSSAHPITTHYDLIQSLTILFRFPFACNTHDQNPRCIYKHHERERKETGTIPLD